ncbi:oligosaccharide flippase family protein [Flavobacterium sp. ZB4P13]|uniref:oligosaccharide flippase family protein n=1 Tax=Flavobacterium sp. ZB4P13 TaxID=3401728 RepID=UPI003AAC6756
MKENINKLKSSLKGKKVKQIILLYSVNIVGIPFAIATNMILTNYLGPKLFGDYSYLNGIFVFAIVVFNFGFLDAANRALLLNGNDEKAREIYGSSFVLLLLLFLIMSFCLLIFGYFDSNINNKGLYKVFLYLIPFGWIYLLTNYFEKLFQADNRIKALAFIRFYPKIGFFLSSLLIYFVLNNLNISKLVIVYVFFMLTYVVIYLLALWRIKPSFKNLKYNFKSLWGHTRNYGFDVYIGSLFASGISNLASLIISNYDPSNSNEGVGFFNLAITFASPLALIPNIIATTHFKEFASLEKIPLKLFKITLFLTLLSLLILWTFIGSFIDIFYGKEYHSAIELTLIISIGVAAYSMADFFNRYLGAHGKGKMLRNSSIAIGISLFITNFLFIPIWHERGAAFASLVSGLVYLVIMIYYYRSYTKMKE